MKKIITFLVLLLTISSMTWAYDFSSVAPSDLSSTPHTDVIGTGTTTSGNFPSHSYYYYSLSQQIYYASEFNAISIGDTIVKIGFQLGAMVSTRNWNIYITTTNQASLSDGFIQISPNDLVWSGTTASMTANAWNEITLYSGIVFNGSNILVTFQDVTGSYEQGNQGVVTATGISGISRYIYRDNDGAYDPTTFVSGGSASAERLNMRFVSGSLNVNRDGDFIFSDRAKTHLIRYTGAGGNITIPSTVTSIGDGAFSACSGLTSVTIPNSVTSIGNYAFNNCSGLTSVIIPNTVTAIGDYAFNYCSSLGSVSIGNSVTSIGNEAFFSVKFVSYCGTAIGAPWGAHKAGCFYFNGDFVFLDSTMTTLIGYTGTGGNVTIPNTVVTIGDSIFYNCRGLASVAIPNSVTSIGNYAFYYCTGLASVAIPNSVTSIGNYAFSYCSGLDSVAIPNSVTSIGHCAFSDCSGLASVTIGNSVTSIGYSAFAGCSGLASVTIGNSVTSISNSAFYNCSGLATVTIPNSVTSIDHYAFYNCSGLTSVTIPNSITSIGDAAFSYCSGLTSVTIPNSVTSISNSAFFNCSGLASVTIPNSVTSIGGYAFSSCSGLASVTIPNSVTSIGGYAFSSCSGLTSVTIPNSVTTIGNYAFSYCSGLTSVTIPNSVTSIGNYAFSDCGGLTSIVLGCTTPPQIQQNTFSVSASHPFTFHIPCNTTETYRNTAIWNRPYFLYVEDMGCPTQVVVIANDTTLGTVTGSGTYLTGQTVTLTATAKPDCHFLSWQNGNSQNPRTITIDSSDSYLTFTAIFALDTFVVTVVSNNPNLGTVSGSGSYLARSTAMLCATPMYDCRFVQWSDGIRTNPRTLCVASDTTLLAIFRVNPDTVFVPVHDTTYIDVHDTTWVPYPVHDTTFIDVHDTTYIPVHDTTFIDVHDTTFIPVHDTIVMHDTVGSRITYYELSILSDNVQRGVVAGNGRFPDSTIVEIAAIPIEGYRFLQWNDGNTDNPRSVQLLGADATFVATFEPSTQSIDALQSDDDVSITTRNGQIVVSNAANRTVRLFDSVGRLLSTSNTPNPTRLFTLPTSGVYLIQVGTAPAHRVVVVQ